jgi:hypothetical protein
MDNVQKVNYCTNEASSQIFRAYLQNKLLYSTLSLT